MKAWLPLISGMTLVLLGGFFVLDAIGHRFGPGWEFGCMPFQWAAGWCVGWFGTSYALRNRGGAR